MEKKYVDESWDFRKANTKQHTHGFHNYPAIMIPQIAGRLIDLYGEKAQLLFDPYCGSGTSLVEASMRGINSIGTDLNPLARLMSHVKSTSINPKLLDNELIKFQDISFSSKFGKVKTDQCEPPAFGNIDYWFDKGVQKKLAFINKFIADIKNKKICDFFKVAFSGTIRDCSWTRNGEFKLYRMTEKQMAKFNPDVFLIMESKLARMRVGMKAYVDCRNDGATAKIYGFDTVVEIPNKLLPRESVDIVVTSPPYGDSRTTVAYGQFSRLSSEWLNLEGARAVDRSLMGGVPANGDSGKRIKCKSLNDAIAKISIEDCKRAKEILAFYYDYKKSIDNVAPLIKKDGYVCYVVGNRKVKGVVLPTDEITVNFFKVHGFSHIETVIRNIPNKRMPSKNSPTNVTGKLDSTMTNEYVVVLKKTG